MNLKPLARPFTLAVACLFAPASAAQTQPGCKPPAVPSSAAPNIFTPEQEMDLGDAVAEHLQRDFRVVEDDALTEHLRRIGAAIVRHVPETGLRFRFFLIDLPDADAFTIPGGRVYISRKLVALAQSEDELAGVVAHEIGHGVARQIPGEMTERLRRVLGVTSVGDRRDIFEKYNQLVENARKAGGGASEHKHQGEADLIGLYAMALAGYDPQGQHTFWDRLTETKGKTGGWFSDLFGTTKPESKRLREMLKSLETLPASCRGARASASPEEFRKWQTAVVAYTPGAGRREAVRGLLQKTRLDPPLRGDVTHLKFSPDGRHLVAQDDSGVNVLARDPFKLLFRIETPEAFPAQFTPDSQAVIFHTPSLRVETWGLAEQKLREARELFIREGCMQTELAPDGKSLACLEWDSDLTLVDVGSGAQVFQKKNFFKADLFDLFRLLALASGVREGRAARLDVDMVNMGFSPDGRYFAAGDRNMVSNAISFGVESTALAFDTTTRAPVQLRGQLKKLVSSSFAFVAPDRVVGVHPDDIRKSGVVTFPAGEDVTQLPLRGQLSPATRPDSVVVRPFGGGFASGVLDLKTKKTLVANKFPALDAYGDFFAAEGISGNLALMRTEKMDVVGRVALPRNTLGLLHAAAVSPDFRWLAVSERSRGAVWDLTKGERVLHVRGFRGAHFGADNLLYADFPKQGSEERTIARVNPTTRAAAFGAEPDKAVRVSGMTASQHGPYLLHRQTSGPFGKRGGTGKRDEKNPRIEMADALTGAPLWSKEFMYEEPEIWVSGEEGTVVLAWATKERAVREEVKQDPALGPRLAAMREKEGDYFLQVLDARTGATLGKLLIETGKGSFHIHNAFSTGDWVVVTDSENRVLVYSLSAGELRGRVFGDRAAVAPRTGLFVVENERGQLSLYDLQTMGRREQFNFPGAVALARFSADGRRLFVLTADQTAYVLDVSTASAAKE